tara:strand:+ start:3830 stop:4672 length:843 start_codon:yes stop_codon:yes gene_type:complete
MKDVKEIERLLKEPFAPEDLEWRISRAGRKKNGEIWAKCLTYVNARAIMDRLDSVVGVDGWRVKYEQWNGGVVALLELKINNEWILKSDGSDTTDIDAFKGGLSGALKRAAVSWGISRYLYNLTENFGNVFKEGTTPREAYDGQFTENGQKVFFKWMPPELPAWALPSKDVTNKLVEDATKATLGAFQKSQGPTQAASKESPEALGVPRPTPTKVHKEEIIRKLSNCSSFDELKDTWTSLKDVIDTLAEDDQVGISSYKDILKIRLNKVPAKASSADADA